MNRARIRYQNFLGFLGIQEPIEPIRRIQVVRGAVASSTTETKPKQSKERHGKVRSSRERPWNV